MAALNPLTCLTSSVVDALTSQCGAFFPFFSERLSPSFALLATLCVALTPAQEFVRPRMERPSAPGFMPLEMQEDAAKNGGPADLVTVGIVPAGFTFSRAAMAAKLSFAAYCPLSDDFDCHWCKEAKKADPSLRFVGRFGIHATQMYGFIAYSIDHGVVYAVFRGTSNIAGWAANLNVRLTSTDGYWPYLGECPLQESKKVHAGFFRTMRRHFHSYDRSAETIRDPSHANTGRNVLRQSRRGLNSAPRAAGAVERTLDEDWFKLYRKAVSLCHADRGGRDCTRAVFTGHSMGVTKFKISGFSQFKFKFKF